jgi:hypothetical protein
VRIGSTHISGNGKTPQHLSIPGSAAQEERKTYLKYALFFLAVAVSLIVARQLGKDASTTSGRSTPTLNVQFDLSIPRISGEVAQEGYQSESGGQVVRFRLSNRGNHPVFCPVRPGTNVLIGHVVYRTTSVSKWMAVPWSTTSTVPNVQEPNDQNLAWIEMPPGGWVDGQFQDLGWPEGDHAYAIDLKPESSAKIVGLTSPPYHLVAK